MERAAAEEPALRGITLFKNWGNKAYNSLVEAGSAVRQGQPGSVGRLALELATISVALGSATFLRRFWRSLMGKEQYETFLEAAVKDVGGMMYGAGELTEGLLSAFRGREPYQELGQMPAFEGITKTVEGSGRLARGIVQSYNHEVDRSGKAKADATLLRGADQLIQGMCYQLGLPVATYQLLQDIGAIPRPGAKKKGPAPTPPWLLPPPAPPK